MEFRGSLETKLPNFGTTIFTRMSAMANEHGAINLSQGFPNFPTPEKLINQVKLAMRDGHNQYAPMAGIMELRERISENIEYFYSCKYNPETEITITPGATLGIYAAISSVVRDKDEVIIIEPAYDSYLPAILLNGGRPVMMEMEYPGYKINWDNLKKLINHRTKMIIINSPNNPTGVALSSADLMKLQKIIEDTDIIVLSDEVYEHIIFDNKEHQSVARFPKLAERSFIVSSFGKTFHTTGWKVGYVCAPEKLMNEFRKVYQFMAFSTHHPSQVAFAKMMKNSEWLHELKGFYQEKRDVFKNLVKGSKFKILECEGSYFQLLNYEKITKEKDIEFCERLIKQYKIAAIPVSVFYSNKTDNHVLRFCFAKEQDTLEKAAEIIHKIDV